MTHYQKRWIAEQLSSELGTDLLLHQGVMNMPRQHYFLTRAGHYKTLVALVEIRQTLKPKYFKAHRILFLSPKNTAPLYISIILSSTRKLYFTRFASYFSDKKDCISLTAPYYNLSNTFQQWQDHKAASCSICIICQIVVLLFFGFFF